MQIRFEGLNYKNLWLSLFESIENSNTTINDNFAVLEKALPDNKEYYDFYVKTFSKKDFPPRTPFIWDKQEKKTGDTLLIPAARTGNYPAVKRLLDNGAFAHIKNENNETAIDIALEREDAQLMKLLLSSPSAKIEPSQLDMICVILGKPYPTIGFSINWQEKIDAWLDILVNHKNVLPSAHPSIEFGIIKHFISANNEYAIEYLLSRKFLVEQEYIQKLANQAKNPKILALLVFHGAIIDPQSVIDDFSIQIYQTKLVELENQQSPTPLEVSKLVEGHLDKATTSVVQQFLFFSAPETRDAEPVSLPQGDPLNWKP